MSLTSEREKPNEKQLLISDANTELELDENYQSRREIKHPPNRAAKAVEVLFDSLWLSLMLALVGLAVSELATVNPTTAVDVIRGANSEELPHILSDVWWLSLISITAGWAFGLWFYGLVAASMNAVAVVKKADKLTCAALSPRLAWTTIQMIIWLAIAAGFASVYILKRQNDWSAALKSGIFLGEMFLVTFFGVILSVVILLRLCRRTCDACLNACKSPCHDL
jgi:hypothetical protein